MSENIVRFQCIVMDGRLLAIFHEGDEIPDGCKLVWVRRAKP